MLLHVLMALSALLRDETLSPVQGATLWALELYLNKLHTFVNTIFST